MKHYLVIINLILCLTLSNCAKKNVTNINLAKNYYQQSLEAAEKNKREALVLIDKSLQLDPTPRSYALKATLLYQINNYQESLSLFEKVINDKNAPTTLKMDISNNYACNLLVLGETDKARSIWLDLTSNRFYLSPEVAWFNLGLLEFATVPQNTKPNPTEIEQLQKAAAYFKKAIHASHDYIDAYFYLAITLIQLEEFDDAKNQLVEIIGIMPEHKRAMELLKTVDKLKRQRARKH